MRHVTFAKFKSLDYQKKTTEQRELDGRLWVTSVSAKRDGLIDINRGRELLEYQLGEVVETVLPDDEIVLTLRIVNEGARDSVLVSEVFELGTVVHQSIGSTAYHPKKFVLFLHLVNIGNELGGPQGVGS